MLVEMTEGTLFKTEGESFVSFAMIGGQLTGTTRDGRLLRVEMIHKSGADGNTYIHYYDEEGEAQVATRHSSRTPQRERVY